MTKVEFVTDALRLSRNRFFPMFRDEPDNRNVGATPDSEIEISMDYDTDQRKVVNELLHLIDEHNCENEDED